MERIKEFKIIREEQINNPNDVFDKIKEIKGIDWGQENFICFYVDTKNKIIDQEVVFKGGLNSCICDAKTLFRRALLANANSVLIAHNHPSDSLVPSNEDEEIYKHLKKCGEILNLKVLDSIIFNKTEYYSMNEA